MSRSSAVSLLLAAVAAVARPGAATAQDSARSAAARQVTSAAPAAAEPPGARLSGPRVPLVWSTYQPAAFPDMAATGGEPATAAAGTHTIRVSTLALVLGVLVLVLLIT